MLSSHRIQSPQHARPTAFYATTPTSVAVAVSCSRARGDSCFLFFARVTFGVGGLILALAAKPVAFDWGGEAHAVRMHGLVTIVAKENAPLVVATVAQDARAFVARHLERRTRLHECTSVAGEAPARGALGCGRHHHQSLGSGAQSFARNHFCVTKSTATATLTTF